MNQLNQLQEEPFNQSDEIRRVLTMSTSQKGFGLSQDEARKHRAMSGCCLSICFQWMKLKMSDSKESAQNRIAKVKLSIPKAITRQKMQEELWKVGHDKNYTAPASYIGVKLTERDLNKRKVKLNVAGELKIIKALKKIKKSCLLMDYRWSDNSGHTVAWYVSSGKAFFKQYIYFFDPNFGEYKIPLKDSKGFVDDYFTAINREFISYVEEYNMIGVKNDTYMKNLWERKGLINFKR